MLVKVFEDRFRGLEKVVRDLSGDFSRDSGITFKVCKEVHLKVA